MISKLNLFFIIASLGLCISSCSRETAMQDYLNAGMPPELIENKIMVIENPSCER